MVVLHKKIWGKKDRGDKEVPNYCHPDFPPEQGGSRGRGKGGEEKVRDPPARIRPFLGGKRRGFITRYCLLHRRFDGHKLVSVSLPKKKGKRKGRERTRMVGVQSADRRTIPRK